MVCASCHAGIMRFLDTGHTFRFRPTEVELMDRGNQQGWPLPLTPNIPRVLNTARHLWICAAFGKPIPFVPHAGCEHLLVVGRAWWCLGFRVVAIVHHESLAALAWAVVHWRAALVAVRPQRAMENGDKGSNDCDREDSGDG